MTATNPSPKHWYGNIDAAHKLTMLKVLCTNLSVFREGDRNGTCCYSALLNLFTVRFRTALSSVDHMVYTDLSVVG